MIFIVRSSKVWIHIVVLFGKKNVSFAWPLTPVLYNLHWLPVEKRLKFKVLMMCFKCLHGLAPKYLSDLLIPYKPGRALRNRQNTLTCQKSSSRGGDVHRQALKLRSININQNDRKDHKIDCFYPVNKLKNE